MSTNLTNVAAELRAAAADIEALRRRLWELGTAVPIENGPGTAHTHLATARLHLNCARFAVEAAEDECRKPV